MPQEVSAVHAYVNMPAPLTAFRRSLSDCNQSPVRYLGLALLADLPVTVAIAFLLNRVTGTTWPEFPADSLPRILVSMCVFSPLVETFGMVVIIWLLRRFGLRPAYVPLITALVCAGLHSLAKPYWGLEIFWAFLIFALCYVTWEKKSPLQAFWMTAILHALHNLLPTLVLIAART
jgi:hypothetical protein